MYFGPWTLNTTKLPRILLYPRSCSTLRAGAERLKHQKSAFLKEADKGKRDSGPRTPSELEETFNEDDVEPEHLENQIHM